MRGSAMGLLLFGGTRLEEEGVLARLILLIRLFKMTFGSATDPSSFTLVSPNMVFVTELFNELFINPRNPMAAELAAPATFNDADDKVEGSSIVVESDVVLADPLGAAGCGILCIDPHIFFIRLGAVAVLFVEFPD